MRAAFNSRVSLRNLIAFVWGVDDGGGRFEVIELFNNQKERRQPTPTLSFFPSLRDCTTFEGVSCSELLWTHMRSDSTHVLFIRYINAAISISNKSSEHQYSITGFLSMFISVLERSKHTSSYYEKLRKVNLIWSSLWKRLVGRGCITSEFACFCSVGGRKNIADQLSPIKLCKKLRVCWRDEHLLNN